MKFCRLLSPILLMFHLVILLLPASEYKTTEATTPQTIIIQVVKPIPVAIRPVYNLREIQKRYAVHISRGFMEHTPSEKDKELYDYIQMYIAHVVPDDANQIAESIIKYSEKHNLDPLLVLATIELETGETFNKKDISSVGATGLMQVMPGTAKWICDELDLDYSRSLLYDIDTNIRMGCWLLDWTRAYMKSQGINDNDLIKMTLIGYNAGPSAYRFAKLNNPDKYHYFSGVNKFYKKHKEDLGQ